MPVTDDLKRLQRELDDLRLETRLNAGAIAGAVRKSRLNLAIAEQHESLRKLRPPTSLLDWSPRPGKPTDPDVQNSLLDRLRQGSAVADSLGNVDPIIASVNMLDDPLFEYYRRAVAFTITAVEQVVSFDPGSTTLTAGSWFGSKTAGTVATVTTIRATDRFGSGTNPFNSNGPSVTLAITGAGTHEFILRSSGSAVFSSIPATGFLVAAIKLARLSAPTLTNVTSRTAILELWDDTVGAAVASASLDLLALSDTVPDAIRLVTAIRWADLTAAQKTHTFGMRLRIQVVTSGAGATVVYHFGEPQLHGSSSPDPAVFAPMVPSFAPGHMVGPITSSVPMALRVADDSAWRAMFNADGSMFLGSGAAAVDLKLSRPAASILRIDNTAAGRAAIEAYAGTGPGAPGAGLGRLYFSSATKSWHQVDDAGVDKDLAVLAADVSQVSRDSGASSEYVARIKLTADTTYRAFLGLDASDRGSLEYGAGGVAARDLRLMRPSAGILQIDTIGSALDSRVALRGTAGQRAYYDATLTGDTNSRIVLSGDATLTGIAMSSGAAVADVTLSRTAANILSLATGDTLNLVSGPLTIASTQILTTRRTGWAAATGTATRSTFATSTVTTAQLAERVKALIDDLIAHGLIGA